ncbi:MAG: sugar ABC transporter permease [Hoeflea sp.]|uniref:carbohydrate ABC transporter permease n=1 Tax=Hoeflea sp. TaxID=1940281 RepID=UPI0032EF937B
MRHSTFFWFVLPSGLAMFLFIALPIVSVFTQSLHVAHEQVVEEVETCAVFSCTTELRVNPEATAKLYEEAPLGRFAGLSNYTNRSHLALKELGQAWQDSDSLGAFIGSLYNLPFYKALTFTLAYTFIVTPLVIVFGFAIAVAVNSVSSMFRGPIIFVSLLPMMVTPLIGSLILFWMIDARGIIGATLQTLTANPDLSLKASSTLTWIMLMVYGVWHSAPFAFVVFYAGLQTVPKDTLESAMIDGASRWERIRYVVLPYLAPLTMFIALIQLMDNFRVFEPIVGFNAEAHATSLSWAIYNYMNADSKLLNSAATTSMLTIVGVAILLMPVLMRTWRDFNRG